MRINPYLTFNGNCEDAFNFYKSVFNKEFTYFGRFNEMPEDETGDGPSMPKEFGNRIMHVSLPISEETVLMGSDNNPMMGDVSFGQQISLSMTPDSREEADRIFKELSQGGKVTMPMDDMFWGDYFGMLEDQFGISWMINYNDSPN